MESEKVKPHERRTRQPPPRRETRRPAPHRPHRELPGADPLRLARHTGSSTGQVEATAPTREEALKKMRNELQYRSEWCACSGASGDTVELQVREERGKP
jgi:hypothetical protein